MIRHIVVKIKASALWTRHRKLLFVSSAVLLPFVATLALWPAHEETAASQPAFLEQNALTADSILNTLTDKEKAALLVFSSFADTLRSPLKSNNTELVWQWNAVAQQELLTDTLPFAPTLSHLMAVRDSSTKTDCYNFLCNKALQHGYNCMIIRTGVPLEGDSGQTGFAGEYISAEDQLSLSIKNSLFPVVWLQTQTEGYLQSRCKALINKANAPCLALPAPQSPDSALASIEVLRSGCQFEGLLVQEIENQNISPENIARLINQGSDLLAVSGPSDKLMVGIQRAVEDGRISAKTLHIKAKRVLQAHLWTRQLPKPTACNINVELLYRRIMQHAAILVENGQGLLPFSDIERKRFYLLTCGDTSFSPLAEQLKEYTPLQWKHLSMAEFMVMPPKLPQGIDFFVFAFFNGSSAFPDSLPLTPLLESLPPSARGVLVHFGQAAELQNFSSFTSILQFHGATALEQQIAGQVLFGGLSADGRLPVPVAGKWNALHGLTSPKTRLAFGIAEEAGLSSEKMQQLDSIALHAISRGAFPGCQVFVARRGIVVYNKCFGRLSYSGPAVSPSSVYDIASLTKTSATTVAAMKMVDLGKISLDMNIGKCFKNTKIEYTRIKPDTLIRIDTFIIKEIPNLKKLVAHSDTIHLNDSMLVAYDTIISKVTPRNNIFTIPFIDLLRHESAAAPVIPLLPYMLYKIAPKRLGFRIKPERLAFVFDSLRRASDNGLPPRTLTDGRTAFDVFFAHRQSDSASHRIAEGMYMHNTIFDSLWMDIKQMPVFPRKVAMYTDANMILVQQAIDSLNRMSLDKFLAKNIYGPLGMKNTGYLPLKWTNRGSIAPTEYDRIWRNQMLHGDVHDPSAAVLGGISGNAGLFSCARDLGILYQMLLNGGSYGGKQYIAKHIVERFTARQADSQRGLGFDKPHHGAIIAPDASPETYGHTGFTGTCAWVDPKEELVFVFLSNRVHPSATNWKIIGLHVRENLHQAVYEAMLERQKNTGAKKPV